MEIERKLASVRRIAAIDPIEGADNIVRATVDGWELVTQKSNNFLPGDLVVYFEIDSFLPITEQFEFLRKSSYRLMGDVPGFRLKTIKLRGQVSQGLILPIAEFFDPHMDGHWYYRSAEGTRVQEGDDLTQLLSVVKWDPPISANLAGKARGNFPSFISKTDQERVQNIFGKLKHLDPETKFEATLKLDGSSCTVYCKSGYVGVCSRNMDLIETEGNSFWEAARKSKLIEALEKCGWDIAIQGELMGPGVQGNRENLKEPILFVFDVYDITESRYANQEERKHILNELRKEGAVITEVPVVASQIPIGAFKAVADFLLYADRPSINHPIAEGVVFKNIEDGDKSFKVISNKFLLKEKD